MYNIDFPGINGLCGKHYLIDRTNVNIYFFFVRVIYNRFVLILWVKGQKIFTLNVTTLGCKVGLLGRM